MKNKIKQTMTYVIYILISNFIYGVILYFLITYSLMHSKLTAYLVNLGFIIICLLLDIFTKKQLANTKKLAIKIESLKNEKDQIRNRQYIRWVLKNYVSFKTSLFFFYIFILLFSQILNFEPTLANAKIRDFIHIIDYSVIILLAFKDFGEEFFKDRKVMQKNIQEYDNYLSNK